MPGVREPAFNLCPMGSLRSPLRSGRDLEGGRARTGYLRGHGPRGILAREWRMLVTFIIERKVLGHGPRAAPASLETLGGDYPQGDHCSQAPERRPESQCGWSATTKRPSRAPERVARVTPGGGAGECGVDHPEDRLPPGSAHVRGQGPRTLPSCGKKDPSPTLLAAC